MPPSNPKRIRYLELGSCKIIYTDLGELKKLVHSYIGETEKNLILGDNNTLLHCLPLIDNQNKPIDETSIIALDPGEMEKNIGSLHYIWSSLQYAGTDRKNTLINIGGGMITDIGGFAASTFKRGIPFINIPTSLMGMADAAIGGKTSANLGSVKNQVGTFCMPEAVYIYPSFLRTLPKEELLSGYAEIIKTALAFDKTLWRKLKEVSFDVDHPDELIKTLEDGLLWNTIQIKVNVVEQDPHDQNLRQGLNFGHSIGHAIEALFQTKGKSIQHGYAVAAGMICEAYISKRLCGLEKRKYKELEEYLLKAFPKISLDQKDIDKICKLILHDKKNRGGEIRMSLIEAPGKCNTGVICDLKIIREALMHYIKL